MKKVVAQLFIKTACIQQFIEQAQLLIQRSRSELGNLHYNLYQDILKGDEFVFIETYADTKALDLHFNSDHVKIFIEKIGRMQSKEMVVEISDVQ